MNKFSKLNKYLSDSDYKITFINNKVNINNYIEILDFSSTLIKIRHDNGITKVIGEDLIISKMMDYEILIEGKIHIIEIL